MNVLTEPENVLHLSEFSAKSENSIGVSIISVLAVWFGLVLYVQLFKHSNSALSTGFFLKIFLEFRKFQPRYSYKIYSWNDDVNCENTNLRDI